LSSENAKHITLYICSTDPAWKAVKVSDSHCSTHGLKLSYRAGQNGDGKTRLHSLLVDPLRSFLPNLSRPHFPHVKWE
jgi:hypothetical protein